MDGESFHFMASENITDGQVVRAGVSVTCNVLSWSEGHEFDPPVRWNLGCVVLLSKSYLIQKLVRYLLWCAESIWRFAHLKFWMWTSSHLMYQLSISWNCGCLLIWSLDSKLQIVNVPQWNSLLQTNPHNQSFINCYHQQISPTLVIY